MKYAEVKNLFKEKGINDLTADIVSCVSAASWNLSDEDFDLVCSYTNRVLDNVDKGYTQLIADIVCDLYQDLDYGYRKDEDEDEETFLTREDLKDHNKIDMVVDMFYDKYYD